MLVCNAAVYQPTANKPSFTADGFELRVGINHLGPFLLSRLLLDDLKQFDYPSKRLIIVGSILLYFQCIHIELFIIDCDVDVLTWSCLYTMNQETQIP